MLCYDRLPNQAHYFHEPVRYKRLTPAGPDHAQVAAVNGIVDYIEALDAHHNGGSSEGTLKHHRTGTAIVPNAAAAVGRRVHDMQRAHETSLSAPLLDFCAGRRGVRLLGEATASLRRVPTVSPSARARTLRCVAISLHAPIYRCRSTSEASLQRRWRRSCLPGA
jgi:hypothetical protein